MANWAKVKSVVRIVGCPDYEKVHIWNADKEGELETRVDKPINEMNPIARWM